MEKKGFIKAHRKLFKSDIWLSEKFTRAQAWMDLIYLTNWKDGFIRVRGVKVDVKRGQCGYSIVKLADRWKWSRGKVKRFLNELQDEHRIEQQTDSVSSLITVINYERYQGHDTADDTANESANGQQIGQQTGSKRVTIEEYKEIKNIKNNIKRKKRNKKKKVEKPDDVSSEVWNDFLDHRKAKKAPVTKTVITLIRNEAKKINWTLERAMEETCARGWQGFKAEWASGGPPEIRPSINCDYCGTLKSKGHSDWCQLKLTKA